VKPILVLLAGAILMWLQPWSEATATPQYGYGRIEPGRSSSSDRCLSGYRKSTTTGRCVRIGVRLPSFRWS
jgi:hypothetical protein